MPSVRVLFLVYLSANSIVLHSAAAAALVELKFSYVVSESAVDPVYGVRLDSTVPAVELALDHVNNNPTLLPGYTLQYNTVLRSEVKYTMPWMDTEFSVTVGFCMCAMRPIVCADKCEGLLVLMKGKVVSIEALPEFPIIIILAIIHTQHNYCCFVVLYSVVSGQAWTLSSMMFYQRATWQWWDVPAPKLPEP